MPGAARLSTYSSVSPHHRLALACASVLRKENVWLGAYRVDVGIPTVAGTKSSSDVKLKDMNPWSLSILHVIKALFASVISRFNGKEEYTLELSGPIGSRNTVPRIDPQPRTQSVQRL